MDIEESLEHLIEVVRAMPDCKVNACDGCKVDAQEALDTICRMYIAIQKANRFARFFLRRISI